MAGIGFELDASGLLSADAGAVGWAVERFVKRAAEEVAREERRLAPKAESTLTNSIEAERVSAFEYRAGPHAQHGPYVGPRGGYRGPPPVSAILDWVKVRRLAPRNPAWDQRDLAWAISRSIARRGTPADHFVQPVRDSGVMRERVRTWLLRGVEAGLKAARLKG
jgi:hypothetical protein